MHLELLCFLFSLKRAFLSRAVNLFFFSCPEFWLPEPMPLLSQGEEFELLKDPDDEEDEDEEEDDDL